MASLGIVLHASLICIVLLTFFSGTASRNIANEILQRLEMVEKLNFDLKKENSNLKLEMIDIKGELKDIVNEMKVWMKSRHSQGNNKMNESNSDLQKENIKIKLEMAELRDQMDNVVRENCEMKKKWNELDDILISVYIHLNKSKPEIQSGIMPEHRTPLSYQHVAENRKANSVRSVQRIVPPAPDVTEQPVAFYAYMDSYHTPGLPIHTTLIFDTVQLNDGHGYSKHDGVFIAPRTGVYVFHWTIQTEVHSWESIEIVVNGSPIGCAASDTLRINDYGTGSGLVATRVNTGDLVFLRTHESISGYLLSNHRLRSSFSGWLLYS
ncbi:uncharacterized protein LOC128171278 [Crassostrea angulata]|uniref:uncharacterized protein LOC128171278 n=1 Tax=Magallana angulata TaxID=2784310 RepID=UPI0022B1E9EF|nr:uncharacterized protein LOC128171278 [Crassostrea angulata]